MISRSLRMAVILVVTLGAAAQSTKTVRQVPAEHVSASAPQKMFASYCASCHGTAGRGDGPAASALKVVPADLTTLSARHGDKFPEAEVANAIRGDDNIRAHGSASMPVWGPIFSQMSSKNADAEVNLRIHNLTKYIQGIQRKPQSDTRQ